MEYNSIFRTGIAFPVLLGTGKNICTLILMIR